MHQTAVSDTWKMLLRRTDEMIRIAKQTDPKRLEELKKKINDKQYLNTAINSLAITITREILQTKEE